MTRAGAIAVATLVAMLTLAACDGTGTVTPGVTGGPATQGPGDSIGEPASGDPGGPTRSETEWGEIWDALPEGFPVPDGAIPTESDEGPVSAAYTVPRSSIQPRAIAEAYLHAIEENTLGGGLDGPLEDGSFTVWGSSGYGCDLLATVTPRGDESLVTVLFGGGCPFRWTASE